MEVCLQVTKAQRGAKTFAVAGAELVMAPGDELVMQQYDTVIDAQRLKRLA